MGASPPVGRPGKGQLPPLGGRLNGGELPCKSDHTCGRLRQALSDGADVYRLKAA